MSTCKSNKVYGGASSNDHNLKYNITFNITRSKSTERTIDVAQSEVKKLLPCGGTLARAEPPEINKHINGTSLIKRNDFTQSRASDFFDSRSLQTVHSPAFSRFPLDGRIDGLFAFRMQRFSQITKEVVQTLPATLFYHAFHKTPHRLFVPEIKKCVYYRWRIVF